MFGMPVITVDGKDYEIYPNVSGGSYIMAGGIDAIHFHGEPSETRLRDLLAGYAAGKLFGEHIGRSRLQNDFRNLMDCQK